MARPLLLIPLAVFAALAGLFAAGMMRDRGAQAPSSLAGQPAPALPETGLEGRPLLTAADLRGGEVTLVNFWASWCPPCRAEHPTLTALAESGLRVAAVAIRDDAANAAAYLAREGDPFFAHGFDPSGRASLDWGVTAPPETFIVAGDGTVLFRFAGPLLGADYERRFLPALQEALAGG